MQTTTPRFEWDYPAPHTQSIRIAASDIDGMGHANNACYVIWCEECAWNHSHALGLTVADYQRLDRGVAIHKASYDYYHPAFEGDELLANRLRWKAAAREALPDDQPRHWANRTTRSLAAHLRRTQQRKADEVSCGIYPAVR